MLKVLLKPEKKNFQNLGSKCRKVCFVASQKPSSQTRNCWNLYLVANLAPVDQIEMEINQLHVNA